MFISVLTEALSATTEESEPAEISGLWFNKLSEKYKFETKPFIFLFSTNPQTSFDSLKTKSWNNKQEQKRRNSLFLFDFHLY